MPVFKDDKGREWDVRITLATVRRLKDSGRDFYLLAENKFRRYFELRQRPDELCEWVFEIVKPQADAAGVSRESFEDALTGDSLMEALKAFASAYTDFFPDPTMRSALREIEKSQEEYLREVAAEVSKGQENLLEAAKRRAKKLATEQLSVEAMERILDKSLNEQLPVSAVS